jgi:RNA polymerase sigma-70 factor (ECF subfamily)
VLRWFSGYRRSWTTLGAAMWNGLRTSGQRTSGLLRLTDRGGEVDEAELVRRLRLAEQDAFRQVWDLYRNRIYGLCLRMTANAADAEDLTQQAFEALLRKIDTLRDEAKFCSWFFTLTGRLAVSHLRHRKRLVLPETDEQYQTCLEGAMPDTSSPMADLHDLQQAIERLPEGYRQIFVLHQVGLSHREIADELGIAESTSRTQLHKARRLLMARLTADPARGVSSDAP